MTVEKAMLNNDLLQFPADCEYTALYVSRKARLLQNDARRRP